MDNSLAVAISVADSKAEYDENIKNILSEKEILAWILKSTTSEFAELSIEKIMKCIEGEPEISKVKVNPGETNVLGNSQRKIVGAKNEDKVPNEGTITYDIRFYAYVPGKKKRIKIILNLEAQKNFYPGYQYDKLSVVLVCLNENMEKRTLFLDMMNTLLSQTMDVEQKKKILEEKFHIGMKSRLGEKVNLMCNLSDLIEERGIAKGRENSIHIMVEMLRDVGFTTESAVEQVADKFEMDFEEVYEIVKKYL